MDTIQMPRCVPGSSGADPGSSPAGSRLWRYMSHSRATIPPIYLL
jgi:hypothetical protein